MFITEFGLAGKQVNRLDGCQFRVDVTEPLVQVVNRVMEVGTVDQCDLQVMLPCVRKCAYVLITFSYGLQP